MTRLIRRDITDQIVKAAKFFKVIAILGPRQSGKTTLARTIFSNHNYVSFEDLDMRAKALEDPRLFFSDYSNEYGLILDEIQHAPHLLSYIQTIVDREKKNGFFVITGSQNILVNQAVTQTLAGRIALLTLFPLSINELAQANLLPEKIEEAAFKGSYPSVYAEEVSPEQTYKYYISSYIERDVRDIKNISSLTKFRHFLQLCAGRVGQIMNFESLGNDLGIDGTTVKAWISVLEASYGAFLLYPFYKNFGKRVIKSPKLFFVDTGIVCSLLNIRSGQELALHHMRGNILENYIISDLFKQYYNLDRKPSLYFWREQQDREIDCILEEALFVKLIEIKAGKTVSKRYFEPFAHWKEIADVQNYNYIIYSGEDQTWPEATVLNWKSARNLVSDLQTI